MTELLLHPAVFAIASYWLFSALIGGMPEPSTTSSMAYRWAFQSLHLLAGNVSTAFTSRFPQFAVPDGATAIHKETTVVMQPPSSS